ncbi:MAG: hypothetical protein M3Y27_06235 [Acidobacteriota bacterium]|nr:hypothetical protein [Acidobacteriota bacterium]
MITETLPAGIALTGVSTMPSAGLLVSSNLAAGTATVTVVAGGQTIVTFIDAAVAAGQNGFVQVCKVAGAEIAAGTNFTFNVAGTPLTVPAGPPPGGTCGAPITVPAGNVVITETLPADIALTGVSTMPSAGLLVSSNLAAGTATVTVVAGGQTIVTFIDAAIPGALVAPSLIKAFGAPTININGVTILTFTLSNANAAAALMGIGFTDTLPAGLNVATPSGLPNGTCSGAITAAGNNITVSGVTLPPAGCTLFVNAIGVSAGSFINTTSTVASSGGTGVAATAPIIVNPILDGAGIYQLRYLANLDKGD